MALGHCEPYGQEFKVDEAKMATCGPVDIALLVLGWGMSTRHLLPCHPIFPVNFVRGEACRLFDDEGRAYVDFEAGSWAAVLGHAHPEIQRVLVEQAGRVLHLGVRTPNHLAGEAASQLLDLVGFPEGKASFLSSGSEAVEFAVQAARCVSGGRLCLGLAEAYLSAYGSSKYKTPAEWHLLKSRELETLSDEEILRGIPFEKIGTFVFEPGGGGPLFVRFPRRSLVESLAHRVQEQGGVVVVNEVTTGFGRTGTWFGHEHYSLRPDLIALGKGLGNGYPVSAVLMREAFAGRLERASYYHAQSHQNNPLGCAVALAVLRLLQEGAWIERGAARGASLLSGLRALATRKHSILEARGRGLLIGLEFKPGTVDASRLQVQLLERGLIVGAYAAGNPAGTGLRLDPPLLLEQNQIDALCQALEALLP